MLAALFRRLAPDQAGALWIGALVTLVVFGDFSALRSRRNAALVALLLMAPLLVDLLLWRGTRSAIVFTAIFAATAFYAAWGLYLALRPPETPWRSNLDMRKLRVLLAALLLLNTSVVFGRLPDDAGIYTSLGAQRWTETGRLPYADPMLKGPNAPAWGAAATYGPLLYVAHLPAQLLLGRRGNPAELSPMDKRYAWPPAAATQITCFLFYLLGLWALIRIVTDLANRETALAVAAVYAAMPYLVGLGGPRFVVGGLPYISHIAPTAVLLTAFVFLKRPLIAGALVAAGAGVLFWPAFIFPAWLGWYAWRRRRDAARFTLGFATIGAAIAAFVFAFTPATGGKSTLRLFAESTLGHQEGTARLEYGLSKFSFWGTHPGLENLLHRPVAGTSTLLEPMFLLFAGYVLLGFVLARRRSMAGLAGLTASLAAAVQLWKTHATGTYVEWYLPFLMIALFARAGTSEDAPAAPSEAGHEPLATRANA